MVCYANCFCGSQFNHQATCGCRLQTGIARSVTELKFTNLVCLCKDLSALLHVAKYSLGGKISAATSIGGKSSTATCVGGQSSDITSLGGPSNALTSAVFGGQISAVTSIRGQRSALNSAGLEDIGVLS